MLKLTGNGFTNRDQVLWNGSARATSYINRETLGATITATDVSSAGTVSVTVTNGSPPSASAPLIFTVAAATDVPALQLVTSTLPGGTVSTVYSTTLTATGGTPPYSWSLASGSLPAALTLSSSGIISGTATAAGTNYFSLMVKDSAPTPQAAIQAESITVIPASGLTPPPQAAGYNLVWEDTFSTLSLSNTGTGSGYSWYNPGVWWNQGPAPSGNITDPSGTYINLEWTSGQTGSPNDTSISTAAIDGTDYHAWTYGYFEVNMKFNPVTGSSPGLWLVPVSEIGQPTSTNGVDYGELDLFEWQSTTPNIYTATLHVFQNNVDIANNNSSNSWPIPSGTDFANYNTYGLLWTPTSVSWYFNNNLIATWSTNSAPYTTVFGGSQPYYLVIGQQMGCNWDEGTCAGTGSSLNMEVQWVRVWQPQ
jgi:hypothetical protein